MAEVRTFFKGEAHGQCELCCSGFEAHTGPSLQCPQSKVSRDALDSLANAYWATRHHAFCCLCDYAQSDYPTEEEWHARIDRDAVWRAACEELRPGYERGELTSFTVGSSIDRMRKKASK